MKKPIPLTLVIPAYNEHQHLSRCLQSIAAQTVMPTAVLVIDNNSTDDTVAIAQRFPFVQVLAESHQGIVYARDRGFNAVHHGLIGRIDADTVLPTDWVERVRHYYAESQHQKRALTGSSYFYNIRFPNLCGDIESLFAYSINRLLLGHYILYGSNMVLPVELWRAVRQRVCRRTDIHEDLDLAIHLHRAGYRIDFLPTLKVGAKMRRVRSGQAELMTNLLLWPRTLRLHGRWTWWLGWVGAILLYAAHPTASLLERLARGLGKSPLPD